MEVLWVLSIFMPFLVLRYYREVLPGEIVQISRHGVKSLSVVPRPEGDPPAFCIFEYVYFARPDTIFEGLNIYYTTSLYTALFLTVFLSCRIIAILCLSESVLYVQYYTYTTVLQGRWSILSGSAVGGS